MLELMTVVAMIAVLAVLVMPTLNAVIANMRLKSATQDLFSHLQQARIQAIRTNSSWLVEFGDNDYSVIGAGRHITVDLSDYRGVTLDHDFSPNTVTFESDGTASFELDGIAGPTGTITLTNSHGKTASIQILKTTGRIRSS